MLGEQTLMLGFTLNRRDCIRYECWLSNNG
jgi:hypothetical protein